MSVKTKNQAVKLNKVVLNNVDAVVIGVAGTKDDKRTNNPGRPVNKQSARYKRLAKQAFYADVNSKFVSGKAFKLSNDSAVEFHYTPGANGLPGCLFNGIGSHECNITYIGRTKATGYTFVLNKRVKVELNLKNVVFVK